MFKTPQTITLDPTLGQLELTDTTGTETITGPKAGVTVSGGGASRVFQVDGGCHRVDLGTDHHRRQIAGNGGGLSNNGGTATLTNCTVSGNSASHIGGGGGVYTNAGGTTTLTNCTVSGNSARRNGGGLCDLSRHDHADRLHRQRQLRRQRTAAAWSADGTRPR